METIAEIIDGKPNCAIQIPTQEPSHKSSATGELMSSHETIRVLLIEEDPTFVRLIRYMLPTSREQTGKRDHIPRFPALCSTGRNNSRKKTARPSPARRRTPFVC